MGEQNGCDAVLHHMEVAIYRAHSQNHLLVLVRLRGIPSCHYGYDGIECCVHWCKSSSSTRNDTGDKDPCIINKNEMSQYYYESSWRSFGDLCHNPPAGPRTCPHLNARFPKMRSYHSLSISVILHHRFGKYVIDVSLWISSESRKSCHISIQHDTAIVLHPNLNLLPALPVLKLLLCLKFIPYVNCVYLLDTDSAMSSRIRKSRARTSEWDMTAECALRWLYDEPEPSVDWC
jgi:hypothetical protein